MTLVGAALGQIAFVHQNIEAILVGIVLLSVTPTGIEFMRACRRSTGSEPKTATGRATKRRCQGLTAAVRDPARATHLLRTLLVLTNLEPPADR